MQKKVLDRISISKVSRYFMQVISGTIQNAVKLESLQSVLEQNRKMTGLIKITSADAKE